jgi:hypothetical protein
VALTKFPHAEYLSVIKRPKLHDKIGLKACTSAEISCTICELLEWK